MGKKIEKEKAIVLLLLIIAVSSVITYFAYNKFVPAEIRTIEMHLTVGNYTGFDVNTSALIFGTVIPTSSVKRTFNVTNTDDKAHKVFVKVKGSLADWTSFSENRFILAGRESKDIDVIIDVPSDAEYGKYEGMIEILLR